VGDMELSIRLPGWIKSGLVPMRPRVSVTGVHVEIVHFAVQQKTGAFRNHSRAVQIFERVGVRDRSSQLFSCA
jgi:hypothetical protein